MEDAPYGEKRGGEVEGDAGPPLNPASDDWPPSVPFEKPCMWPPTPPQKKNPLTPQTISNDCSLIFFKRTLPLLPYDGNYHYEVLAVKLLSESDSKGKFDLML